MKIATTLVIIFFPFVLMCQDLKQLIEDYVERANRTMVWVEVYDEWTITCDAKVNWIIGRPVYEKTNCDTVKVIKPCPETAQDLIGDDLTDKGGEYIDGDKIVTYVKIKKACSVKKVRVEPFSTHFWNWILKGEF